MSVTKQSAGHQGDDSGEIVGAVADRASLGRGDPGRKTRFAPDAVSDRVYNQPGVVGSRPQNFDRPRHHGASMTSERRYAITVSLSGFASAR